jgi:hypothetical protein
MKSLEPLFSCGNFFMKWKESAGAKLREQGGWDTVGISRFAKHSAITWTFLRGVAMQNIPGPSFLQLRPNAMKLSDKRLDHLFVKSYRLHKQLQ